MLGGLGLYVAGEEWPVFEVEEADDPKAKKKPAKMVEETAADIAAKAVREQQKQQTEERRVVSSQQNHSLVNLDVSGNAITHAALAQLAQSLPAHTALLEMVCEDTFGAKSALHRSEREEALSRIAEGVKTNMDLRTAVLKVAFLLGTHRRVGARSTVKQLSAAGGSEMVMSAEAMTSIWDFVGPV